MFGIDVSYLQVKVNEGALFPTVTLQTSVQQSYEQTLTIAKSFGASTVAQLSMPIYQGGAEYSLIRQSKETLAQRRLNLEQVRDQARASTVTAWGQLVAGKAQVQSAQSRSPHPRSRSTACAKRPRPASAPRSACSNAQQALVNARVALVTAPSTTGWWRHSVLNTIGRLSPIVLNLNTNVYDPSAHYQQVRDGWSRRSGSGRTLRPTTGSPPDGEPGFACNYCRDVALSRARRRFARACRRIEHGDSASDARRVAGAIDRWSLDLGTSQAVVMKIPACISGTQRIRSGLV